MMAGTTETMPLVHEDQVVETFAPERSVAFAFGARIGVRTVSIPIPRALLTS